MVKEPVQDGGGGGHVTNELASLLDRSVAGHDRRPQLVPPHDDLEQVLAGPLGELLEAHVVGDEKVSLEILPQYLVLFVEGPGFGITLARWREDRGSQKEVFEFRLVPLQFLWLSLERDLAELH